MQVFCTKVFCSTSVAKTTITCIAFLHRLTLIGLSKIDEFDQPLCVCVCVCVERERECACVCVLSPCLLSSLLVIPLSLSGCVQVADSEHLTVTFSAAHFTFFKAVFKCARFLWEARLGAAYFYQELLSKQINVTCEVSVRKKKRTQWDFCHDSFFAIICVCGRSVCSFFFFFFFFASWIYFL